MIRLRDVILYYFSKRGRRSQSLARYYHMVSQTNLGEDIGVYPHPSSNRRSNISKVFLAPVLSRLICDMAWRHRSCKVPSGRLARVQGLLAVAIRLAKLVSGIISGCTHGHGPLLETKSLASCLCHSSQALSTKIGLEQPDWTAYLTLLKQILRHPYLFK